MRCYYTGMKLPVEYADKLLWLSKYIQRKEYLYGSKKYGWVFYELPHPNIILEKSRNSMIFSNDNWIIDVWVTMDFLKSDAFWNDTVFGSPHLNDDWRYTFKVDFLGDLDNFVETVTYLYLINQN